RFLLNVSDHIRDHKRQRVTDWHVETLTKLGLHEISRTDVLTQRMRYGENADARVDAERVITFEKPTATTVATDSTIPAPFLRPRNSSLPARYHPSNGGLDHGG